LSERVRFSLAAKAFELFVQELFLWRYDTAKQSPYSFVFSEVADCLPYIFLSSDEILIKKGSHLFVILP
jgi:hypothetical protein